MINKTAEFNNIYFNNETGKNIKISIKDFPKLGDEMKTHVKGCAWTNSKHQTLIPVYGLNSSVPIENITILEVE